MIKKTYHLLLIALTIITASCTERIDLDLDGAAPVIVIYGSITDTLAYQSIAISSSAPYFDNQPNPVVSGAKVSITSSDNESWELIESNTEKGTYLTQELKAGKEGTTYHLKVLYDFDKDGVDETYEATATMLPRFGMDSVEIKTMKDMSRNLFTIHIYGQEPEGEDHYMSKFYVSDTLATKFSKFGLLADKIFDGQYLNGLLIFHLSDLAEIDDYSDDDLKYETFASSGDEVIVEFCRVEKAYYNFIDQAQGVKYGENPIFGGPPSNIQGNISNGAVGFFAAYSPSRLKAKVP